MTKIQNLLIGTIVFLNFILLTTQSEIIFTSQVHSLSLEQNIREGVFSPYSVDLIYENKYHNLSELYTELSMFNMSASELVDYMSIGESYYNNSIPLIIVTNENIPLTQKGKTLLIAHHHAREACTIETTLRLIRDLINEYGTNPSTTRLLDQIAIYVIVTLNPDGLDYWLYQNNMHRKNLAQYDDDLDNVLDEDGPEDLDGDGSISEYAATLSTRLEEWITWTEGIDNDGDGRINEDWPGGTDLNRNYPFHWNDEYCDSGSTFNLVAEDWQGPSPLSEPETKVLDTFVKNHKFTHAISLHSGTNASLFGWSWKDTIFPENKAYEKFVNLVQERNLLPNSFFKASNDIYYTCAGEWGDYFYSEYNILPLTLEIYHKEGSEQWKYIGYNGTFHIYERDYYFYFNPSTEKLESLHEDIVGFEKAWFDLTPKINLNSIKNVTLIDGRKEIRIALNSGSNCWNTTDSPQISVKSSVDGAIKGYPTEISPLLPAKDTILIISLNNNISSNFDLAVNITSDYATDLHLYINVDLNTFKSVRGFETSLLTLIPIILLLKKRRGGKIAPLQMNFN